MEHQHRPDRENDGWCRCGAQEVYFEDPFKGRTGYGCEVDGPYADTLDRHGFHVHAQRTLDHMSDETWDSLTVAQMRRVDSFKERLEARRGGRRGGH